MKMSLKKLGLGVLTALGVSVLGLLGFVAYGILTAEQKLTFKNTPYPKVVVSQAPDVIERGRYLALGPAHCVQCHGQDERGKPEANRDPKTPLSGGLIFDAGPFGKAYAANLTPDRATGIGSRSPAELARAIRSSVLPDGRLSVLMRFGVAELSDDDLSAVVSYLVSQVPVSKPVPRGEWTPLAKSVLPLFKLQPGSSDAPRGVPPAASPSVERGEYLAEHVTRCVACHTASDPMTREPLGPKAGGSLPDQSHGHDADKEFVAPNLTADPRTGRTGQLSEDEFLARIRRGRLHVSSVMPWESLSAHTSDDDIRSIYRYLRTLPTVHREVGPTYRERGWKQGE